jgi:uncharacterized protein (TIGR02391 family)
MATLRMDREQIQKMLREHIREGEDIEAKVTLAEKTRGFEDWFQLLEAWRKKTIADLKAAYQESDIPSTFGYVTEINEASSPEFTFRNNKTKVRYGIQNLENLIERMPLALPEPEDATAIRSLHQDIYLKCRDLYVGGQYPEAVEKGFKVVRDRLHALTTHETGSEAFGKGKLYIPGAAAPKVDPDFQQAVKFLTMSIDFFRNEKAHTSDGNINDPIRAYEYLRLSSLAMHLLDKAIIREPSEK